MSADFVTTDSYDTNYDGGTDAQLIDTDGDNIANEERYDVNGDGISDYTEYQGPFPTA